MFDASSNKDESCQKSKHKGTHLDEASDFDDSNNVDVLVNVGHELYV